MPTLSHSDLLRLKRMNTPTIYNGWEQITQNNRLAYTNRTETHDYMPQMGPMIGYAVTVVIEPSNPQHLKANPDAAMECLAYIANVRGPKIVVVQDLDQPNVIGSFWGEVNSNRHRALGCVGTITDGAIRDVDEMTNAGFKALAARLCVGHAYNTPVFWNCPVEVFGCNVKPGQLIHADKHGFLVIPEDDQSKILDAALFMDGNECDTVIASARSTEGLSSDKVLESMRQAGKAFSQSALDHFGRKGEW